MDTALALLQLFNLAAPGVANLVLMIRRNDGTISIVALLDEADSKFTENLGKAQDWLKNHPVG